ncbi:MAG: hypothetical protein IT459_01965 [Planctomycetes bacterium]|nr:hypothetical protein [Planctomycetota bacterium]
MKSLLGKSMAVRLARRLLVLLFCLVVLAAGVVGAFWLELEYVEKRVHRLGVFGVMVPEAWRFENVVTDDVGQLVSADVVCTSDLWGVAWFWNRFARENAIRIEREPANSKVIGADAQYSVGAWLVQPFAEYGLENGDSFVTWLILDPRECTKYSLRFRGRWWIWKCVQSHVVDGVRSAVVEK